ncbi:MAG TPA: hypothetical protein VEY50_03130 [Lysobacter sp.]|nr:hypothetical protein [Lysobacter sp.]
MTARDSGSANDSGRGGAQAGGQREGLRHPTGAGALDQRLQGDNPDELGERIEDGQRDRHGKGVAGGYDDAVDAGADERAPRGPLQSD